MIWRMWWRDRRAAPHSWARLAFARCQNGLHPFDSATGAALGFANDGGCIVTAKCALDTKRAARGLDEIGAPIAERAGMLALPELCADEPEALHVDRFPAHPIDQNALDVTAGQHRELLTDSAIAKSKG